MRIVMIVLFVALHLTTSWGQRTISGLVTDAEEQGLPLIGVNVYSKENPNQGTITDIDGTYSLEVATDATTLVFSYLGYETQEIEINGRSEINVELGQAAELLDEVIVSAFGVKREKKAIGYAAQEVQGDALVNSRETNVVSALSGKVAGVEVVSSSGNPGASANIVIRGRTSFSGSNSPLFVIDGVPIDNSYAGSNFSDQSNRAIDLNPNDIESISVLKGTAATALYGIRAGNGAIIITTKKGSADGNTRVSFSTSLTFDQVNKLPQQQSTFAQGIGGVYVDPEVGTPSSWGPRIDTLVYADAPSYNYSEAGRIVGQSHPLATNEEVVPFDNVNSFFQTGVTSNSNLMISGGQEVANYLVSLGYHNQTGIVPNSDFQRLSARFSGSVKPWEKVTVSSNVTYTNSGGNRQQRGSNLSGVMLGLMRTPGTFDLSNGFDDPVNTPSAYSFADGTQRNYNPSYDNPYWSVNRNLVRDRVNRVIGNVQAEYQPAPWLTLLYRVGLDYYFEERKSYWDGQSGEFRSINGLVINDQYSFSGLTSDILATFEKRLSDPVNLRVTAGHSLYDERAYNAIQEGESFIIPGFYDISNTQTLIVDDFLSQERIVGAFYEVEVGLLDWIYLTTTGRNDWSSTLPADNNSFFYPSASIGLVFSEPLGLSTNSTFSYGKLRFSAGEVGNDAPGPYLPGVFFNSVTQVQGRTSFLRGTQIGSNDLQPESTRSLELGLELRFFRNRLGLDVTAYRNLSVGQILSIPVANSSGFVSVVANAGEVENKGIEGVVTATPLTAGDFSWDITANFSLNRNIVLEVDDQSSFIGLPGSGLTSTRNVILANQPYGVIFGTQWARDEAGNILIDDAGYPIMDQENGVVGDPNPDWLLGVRNSLNWKNWSFSALVDIRRGGDIFNGTRGVMSNLGIHADTEDREEEVVLEGVRASDGMPNTTAIRLDENYYNRYPFAGVSEAGIEDGSFVRLRELTLAYQFGESILERLPFESANFSISGRNLFLWTPYSGIDPETNLSGASNSFGRDYFNSPNTRSVGASIQIIF
jgi:TonB-linked SusC/RagA family outer membrane protein